jgi:hypothetical protein
MIRNEIDRQTTQMTATITAAQARYLNLPFGWYCDPVDLYFISTTFIVNSDLTFAYTYLQWTVIKSAIIKLLV